MHLSQSSPKKAGPVDIDVAAFAEQVSCARLRQSVEALANPRHYIVNSRSNQRSAAWIAGELEKWGYATQLQGRYGNVVALPKTREGKVVLVGAHYDSVPETPGADDNASAVAVMLECARLMAVSRTAPPAAFVAFNCEEDGLLGSTDFVTSYLAECSFEIGAAHILEMIGYADHTEGSQRIPPGLPIKIPSTGNFIGLLGNRDSKHLVDSALVNAATYTPGLPTLGLKVSLGIEKYLTVLGRSDHRPFWQARIPAMMWTDTAEFRNPNYHLASDIPDTLDYDFMRQVTQLLMACVCTTRCPD